MPRRLSILRHALATLVAGAALHAQTTDEFELKNGRRIPAASVKATASGFAATVTVGATAQTLNFTTKDIARASFREPTGLAEARVLTASGKPEDAAVQLAKLSAELAPFQSVPGSWWHRAAILQMDALAARGKADEAAALVDPATAAKLPPEAAALLSDFQQIVAKPSTGPDLKVTSLQALAKRSGDSWLTARAWLEVGNVLAGQGKIEDAVKAWLRVPVFHAAESDLAVRGLVAAARGLQQLERPEDGVKLIADYLSDHLGTPYAAPLQAEIIKLDPAQKKKLAPAETKDTGEATPTAPAKEPAAGQPQPATPPQSPAQDNKPG